MKTILYAFVSVVALASLTTLIQADEKADRASLIGAWVQNGGTQAWVIGSQPDGLHITEIQNSAPVADFHCNTYGDDCAIKIAGHKASVSMYYNGAALVEMETRGDEIVKRRFSIEPSGNSMKLEVTPMSGHVQTEELEFERGQVPAGKK